VVRKPAGLAFLEQVATPLQGISGFWGPVVRAINSCRSAPSRAISLSGLKDEQAGSVGERSVAALTRWYYSCA
jgi:hypothetical protein